MDFYAELDQIVELLRKRGRVSYRALKEQFGLDDARIDALRAELLYAHADTITDDGQGLIWSAERPVSSDAERRQLTVLFCDLVDSTPLSRQLDPEDLREVMRAYYETCGKVIARFDGYIAQYLGDGLLVFFGYPRAHEDDAQRAVRAGLEMIEAVTALNAVVREQHGVELAVRLGCHTGLVVVGEVVGEARHELMAMGDTPNIAARLQAVAAPNTLVIGPLTHQLVGGFFDCRSLGTPPLKGVAAQLEVYEVLREGSARTRLEAIGSTGLTPLVGRLTEIRKLEERWTEAMNGRGNAVLIDGEAGIGKSRLVHVLSEHAVEQDGWLVPCQGSPYHRDTALYPFIDLFEKVVLRYQRPDSPVDRTNKLAAFFAASGLPLEDSLPHLCSLLSLPPPPGQEAPELPPDQQKQQTMLALLSIIRRRAAQQPVLFVIEDLHWVDPTTVELLTLLIEQIADARVLALFTCRPEFHSPWTGNPNISAVSLTRLPPTDASELIRRVAGDKAMPDAIVADVVAKTDGVPLFIEELTKTLLESDLLTEQAGHYELAGPLPPLAIPNTLHDSLMARLDRLSAIKGLAQLGAAIGREFSFALLRSVSPWSEGVLQDGLAQLVAAEFLHQQGAPPQATYRFKHALIQDAAYQSLLKSTRQRHHQRIAAAMESGFPETVEAQPELLAHHYTEAGLPEHAVPYWYAAASRALQRHASQEAANHATRGLELLGRLPDTPDRARQELSLQLVLGPALSYVTGPHSVGHVHARAYELARELGDTSALFPPLAGLVHAKIVHGEMREARALAEEYLTLAEPQQDALVLSAGHSMLAYAAWWQGDVVETLLHSPKSIEFYDPAQHLAGIAVYNSNPRIVSGYLLGLANWILGYPDQATEAMEKTLAHAEELQHPNSVGVVLLFLAQLAQFRREPELAIRQADECLAIATKFGLPAIGLWCLLPRGWAFAQQGDIAAGIADIREAMDRRRALGMGAVWPWYFALLAEAQGLAGEVDDGLSSLDEALGWVERNDERLYEAEVHRLKGELLLLREAPDTLQAERCFEQALTVARDQQAKSWELRAAMSMARMWQAQGRSDDAHRLLAPVFGWFTEGFDTADLREAQELLAQLS